MAAAVAVNQDNLALGHETFEAAGAVIRHYQIATNPGT